MVPQADGQAPRPRTFSPVALALPWLVVPIKPSPSVYQQLGSPCPLAECPMQAPCLQDAETVHAAAASPVRLEQFTLAVAGKPSALLCARGLDVLQKLLLSCSTPGCSQCMASAQPQQRFGWVSPATLYRCGFSWLRGLMSEAVTTVGPWPS